MQMIKWIVIVSLGALVIGCGTQPVVDVEDLPDWVLNPPLAEDAVYGIGEAKMSTISTSRTMAVSRARDDVARQVEVTIKNALTDYFQEAGEGENTQAVQFVESVSRQIAEVTLNGARAIRFHILDDGTHYALVEYPVNSLSDAANESFARNDAAQFAEFKAEQALERLDQELKSNPPSAGE